MRFLAMFYDVAVFCIVLGLMLGVFGFVLYLLTEGMLAYFFQIDLDLWIKEAIGPELRELFGLDPVSGDGLDYE